MSFCYVTTWEIHLFALQSDPVKEYFLLLALGCLNNCCTIIWAKNQNSAFRVCVCIARYVMAWNFLLWDTKHGFIPFKSKLLLATRGQYVMFLLWMNRKKDRARCLYSYTTVQFSPKSRCSVASPSENRALHTDKESLRSQVKPFLYRGKYLFIYPKASWSFFLLQWMQSKRLE